VASAKILVVEDNRTLRVALSAALIGAGYDVTPCADGEEAIRVVQRDGCFDVVIMDYRLGGRTGAETALELEQLCRGMPVVFCTGYSVIDLPDDPPDNRRHVVLTKPVTDTALLEAVEALLREPPGQ